MRSRASQTSASSSKAWRRGKKPESSFYIVPSKVVATHIRNNHQQWLETPGKKGQAIKRIRCENSVKKRNNISVDGNVLAFDAEEDKGNINSISN